MIMVNRVVAMFILMGCFFCITSCTKKADKGSLNFDTKETLFFAVEQEIPTLDFSKAADSLSGDILDNIMEGLAQYDLSIPNIPLKPALAEQWESSDKSKKWIIYLRKGVKWSDGVEFTAQHIVDGWKRLLNPKTASEYASFLFALKNGKEYNAGKISDFSQVGVKALDNYKIEVNLAQSMSFFPYLLTHSSTYPVRQDLIDKFGIKWTEPEHMVTLGPFKLKQWTHDKMLVLERNDLYYGIKPFLKYVVIHITGDSYTTLNLFESGKIDIARNLPNTDLKRLKKLTSYKTKNTLSIAYYGFNITKKPFDNVNFRKAFVHAIDRNEIVKMLDGGESVLSGWLPAGVLGHDQNIGLKFDAIKAKEYLKKSKVKLPLKITLAFNTNDTHKRVAENVQAQLKRNLGLEIELQNEEWKVYLSRLRSSDTPQVYRNGWNADYPDPDNFMNIFTSYSEGNHAKWKDAKYDSLVARGVEESNPQIRATIYVDAQKILLEDDVAVCPLFVGVSKNLIADNVEGFSQNSINKLSFKQVKKK